MNRYYFIRIIVSLLILSMSAVSGMAVNRALLVGIGKYDRVKTGWSPLHGDNDVALLKPLLKKRGFSDIVTLTNSQATKAAIVGSLKELAKRCRPGDRVFFLFSGHGQPVRDDNGDEGKDDRYDESIIPYDACRDTRRLNGTYVGQFHLIDDELCPLFDAVKRGVGPDGEFFVVVDACYSRGIQKDEMTELDPDLVRYIRGTNYPFNPPRKLDIPVPKGYTKGAKLTVVTACRETERNYEYKAPSGKMYGSLSFYLSILLKTDADFDRWRRCFADREYTTRRIFQPSQHPSIDIIP